MRLTQFSILFNNIEINKDSKKKSQQANVIQNIVNDE